MFMENDEEECVVVALTMIDYFYLEVTRSGYSIDFQDGCGDDGNVTLDYLSKWYEDRCNTNFNHWRRCIIVAELRSGETTDIAHSVTFVGSRAVSLFSMGEGATVSVITGGSEHCWLK